MQPIVAVMPLRVSRSQRDRDFSADAQRALLTLLSLESQFRGQGIFDLHIVCPTADLPVIARRLGEFWPRRLRLTLRDEADFIGADVLDDPSFAGSTRQQLVKLAFAARCPAPFVLTLDSDIVLIRHMELAQLVPDGRGVMQSEAVTAHPEWWEASSSILGGAVDYAQGMSVTPAVLSSDGVRSLVAALTERAGGQDWRRFLAERRRDGVLWTEYTLYFHHLATTGQLDTFHIRHPAQRIFTLASVWRPQHFDTWSMERALKGQGWFTVIQSSTGIPVEDVHARIRPVINAAELTRLAPAFQRV